MRSHPLELKLKKDGILNIAGIDEAGRGPWAGPLVAAAVILHSDARLPGLNDSKKLSESQRLVLFQQIMKKASIGVGIIPRSYIDKFGLSKALHKAFQDAINELRTKPKYLLIDGIGKYNFKIPYTTIKKGDSKVRSIAAASIIAKVVRDTLMDSYALKYPNYGFEKHKGYGTRQHHQNLLKYGVCKLHRTSFAPIKKLINDSK